MTIAVQIVWLFILAIPIACVSWTVTHEEIFREPHEWCVRHSKNDRYILSRKFFYLFTCEYCFSHYVTIVFLVICDYKLLLNDWRGYFLAGFSLVFMANVYMSLFALLRQAIKKEKVEIEKIESETDTENSKN
ncbi:hypothetical protein AAYQ05_12880 [Flavobacterium sp. B11]|uniref:hypothetical protein n=1 Tax=Flavobacterium movens TaxID=214860 RepID=UPI0031D6F788